MDFVAGLEYLIGLCFLTGRFLRIGVWLMGAQMMGVMSPRLIYPQELFINPYFAPTLADQYITKDIILIATGMVIAATWTGARIVAQPQSLHSTLSRRLPKIKRISQPEPALVVEKSIA